MNRFRHPEGSRLPALERNILKYRAFEMALILFYAEHLKERIIGGIQATDRVGNNKKNPRINLEAKNKFKLATTILVNDKLLTLAEQNELTKLVNFRNDIAHRIHEMTFDVSRDRHSRQWLEFSELKYDYNALERITYFYNEIPERMWRKGHYVTIASMNHALFSSAEKTYRRELKLLHRKIEIQLAARRKRLGILKKELSLEATDLQDEDTTHPANQRRNGTLSRRGIEICYRLFDHGKRPIVVAHLMYISLTAARFRHRTWIKAGGKDRKPGALSARPR